MAELWEVRDDESPQAFDAFRTYRELGIERSIRKAVQEYLEQRDEGFTESRVRQWEEWSAKYEWVRRARAWDAELDRTRLEAEKAAVAEMRKQHITEARGLQAVAIASLQQLQKEIEKDPEKHRISNGLLLQFMTQGAQMERLARGEPTEIQKALGAKQYVEVIWGDEELPDDDDFPDDDAVGQDAEAASGAEEDPSE